MTIRKASGAITTSAEGGTAPTADSFANFAAKLGTNRSNLQGGAVYLRTLDRTRNWAQLESMYRGSWIIRKGVDGVADDMTREGIDFISTESPDDLAELTQAMDTMGLWDQMGDGIRWARLYGGGVGVLLIDGQDMATPLDIETVGRDQFKGMYVLDRWQINVPATFSPEERVTEFGPNFGMPLYYDVMLDGSPLSGRRIHYSRIIRYRGARLPYRQKWAEQFWDESYVEVWFDRLVGMETAFAGASQLIHKAHLRTFGIEGLREILATGSDQAKQGLYANVEFMRVAQTIEGLTMMDSKDKFSTNTYTFAGLDDLLSQFSQQTSAAMDYPMVRLFGISPGGLNATGDTDMEMYYAKIKQDQERERAGVQTLVDLSARSVLGRALAKGTRFVFRPLDPLDETAKAEIFNKVATTIASLASAGTIMRPTALRELQALAEVTGYGTNITEEDIEDAENDPPPIDPRTDPNAGPGGGARSDPVEGAEGADG